MTFIRLFEKLICLILVFDESRTDIITSPPVDTSVCYGGLATLNCGSDRDDIKQFHWVINSEKVTAIIAEQRKVSFTVFNGSTNLTIIGLPTNDGITIGCTAVSSQNGINTEAATLTVTDIPPVQNLSIWFDDSKMFVTWPEPPCLPQHFVYSLSITNGSHIHVVNTTDTFYSMRLWSNCTANYTVSVIVTDTGYTKKQSLPIVETNQTNPEEPDITFFGIPSIIFNNHYLCSILFHVRIIKSCHTAGITDVPTMVIQKAYSPPGMEVKVPSNPTRQLKSEDDETYYGNYSFGPFFERFKAIFFLSFFGRNSEFDISTFNVQNFSLLVKPDGLDLVCSFALNSSADGCSVTFTSTSSGMIPFFIPMAKNGGMALMENVTIPAGDYDVKVFDVVNRSKSVVAAINLTTSIVLPQSIVESSATSSQTTPILSSIVHTSIASSSPQPEEERSILDFVPVIAGCLCILLCAFILLSISCSFIYCKCIKRNRKVDSSGELSKELLNTSNKSSFPMKAKHEGKSTQENHLIQTRHKLRYSNGDLSEQSPLMCVDQVDTKTQDPQVKGADHSLSGHGSAISVTDQDQALVTDCNPTLVTDHSSTLTVLHPPSDTNCLVPVGPKQDSNMCVNTECGSTRQLSLSEPSEGTPSSEEHKEPHVHVPTCTTSTSTLPPVSASTPDSTKPYYPSSEYELENGIGSLPHNINIPPVNEKQSSSSSKFDTSTATDQNDLQNSIILDGQGRSFLKEDAGEEKKKGSNIIPVEASEGAALLVPRSSHLPAIQEETEVYHTSIDAQQETSTTEDLTHDKTPHNTIVSPNASQHSADAVFSSSNLPITDMTEREEETMYLQTVEGTAVFESSDKPVSQDKKIAQRKPPQNKIERSSDQNHNQENQDDDENSLDSAPFRVPRGANDEESTPL